MVKSEVTIIWHLLTVLGIFSFFLVYVDKSTIVEHFHVQSSLQYLRQHITFLNFMKEQLITLLQRTPYIQDSSTFFRDNRRTLLLSILLFLAALFFRSWQNILNPGLYMEDAAHYFNIYYGMDREFEFILQHPNGYYNILNNFIAWLTAKSDVRLHPLCYHLFSLALGITVASCFIFTGILRNRWILLITPLTLGLSGMNHIYYYVSLTFQMYNVVVLLLCLLFFPIVRSSYAICLLCLITTILIWSGPYSVVALPTAIMLMVLFRTKAKIILFLSVIVNVLLYSLSVKESTIQLINITDKGIQNAAIQVLFEQVFFLESSGENDRCKHCHSNHRADFSFLAPTKKRLLSQDFSCLFCHYYRCLGPLVSQHQVSTVSYCFPVPYIYFTIFLALLPSCDRRPPFEYVSAKTFRRTFYSGCFLFYCHC